jgi:hypothetical protein
MALLPPIAFSFPTWCDPASSPDSAVRKEFGDSKILLISGAKPEYFPSSPVTHRVGMDLPLHL